MSGGENKRNETEKRLSLRGYSVPLCSLSDAELRAVRKELTVTPVVAGGATKQKPPRAPPPSFILWRQGRTRLFVPKQYGLRRFGAEGVKICIPEGAPFSPDVRFNGSLRQEQLPPVDAFLKAATDPCRMGGILSLPCGCGKTVLALHIAARLGVKTLVVVHKNFLLEQWGKRIREFLPGARVGLLKAKTVDVADKDVVLASLQSLSMKDYDAALFSDFGFMIIDEVHHTGAEVFSRALQNVNVRRSLGLSATVKRKDGLTKVFTWCIGDVVYAVQARNDPVRVVIKRYYDPDPSYSEEPTGYGGGLNTSRMINNVTKHPPRTSLIATYLVRILAAKPSRRILVLSDRLEQLTDIREAVEHQHQQLQQLQLQLQHATAASSPNDDDRNDLCGMYVGGMKAPQLAESEKRRVILATFNFASEGFDVPGLDTLILASPKTDVEQSVGRILRQKPSDRVNAPLVLDIADAFSCFEAQAKRRKSFYSRNKYPMVLCPLHQDPDLRSAACDSMQQEKGDSEDSEGSEGREDSQDCEVREQTRKQRDGVGSSMPDYGFLEDG